jgi:hypothetical protein
MKGDKINLDYNLSHPHQDTWLLSPKSRAVAERRKCQRRQSVEQDQYINCDYILGSVAEVERLWSLAKYVLQDHRSSMSLMNLEAILFLKVNSEYWDLTTVDEAFRNVEAAEKENNEQSAEKENNEKKNFTVNNDSRHIPILGNIAFYS